MTRLRTNRQTAVRITVWDEPGPTDTQIWVVENYSPDAMRRVIEINPDLFPRDLRFSFRAIMTWHSRRRFLKWALSRRPGSLIGWKSGMRLA